MKNLNKRRYNNLGSLMTSKNPEKKTRQATLSQKLNTNILQSMDRETETKEFFKLKKRYEGICYLIEADWINTWLKGTDPGIVRTMDLLDAKGRLKPKLRLKKDYFAYNKKQWDFLERRYGAEPLVMRTVEELGIRKKQKTQSKLLHAPTFGETIRSDSSSPIKRKKTPPQLPFVIGDIDTVWLDKVYSPIFGLVNPGLMCYMNAALQMIVSIPTLCLKLLEIQRFKDQTAKSFVDFLKEVYQKNDSAFRPGAIWKAIGKVFVPEKQHDLPEFVRFLVNSLNVPMFSGTFLSTVTCENCLNESRTKEQFFDIQVGIKNSLMRSLQSFTSEEKIEAVSPCEKCGAKNIAKKIEVLEGPECLFIQLKRFAAGKTTQKLNTHVELSPLLSLSKKNYELAAIAVHTGTVEFGHYFAYCSRNGLWYLFDDERVHKVDFEEVLKQQAYLILYKEL